MFKKFYKPSGQSSKANKGARLYSNSTSKIKKKNSIIIQTGYGQAKMTKQWLSNKKRKRKKRLNNLVSAVAQVNEVIALTCKPFFFFWL